MSFSSSRKLSTLLLSTTALLTLSSAAFAGSLSGTVTDQSRTSGLGGAEVTVAETGQSVATGTDGSFRFADLPAGRYTLSVTYAGAETQTRNVDVPATGLVSADFSLNALSGGTTVLVIGQRANLTSNLQRQRSADGVQTTLSRDSIGQFPDQNVAESMRRAPGINVLNDQGEGRFVSVRGLDPNLNSASINGTRVLATGGDDRSVAMDVVPAELIESIDIKKSLTPDMDADTIGASIEINTTSVFDRKKNLFTASVEGSYNDLNGKTSPKASADFSYRITPDFGVAGGLSYYKREFSTDNIEMAGWKEGDDGVVFAEELEYRDYDVTRERYGFTLNFDWRVSDNTTLYARSLYSKFDDTELRRRTVFLFDQFDEVSAASGNTVSFDAGDERIEVRRDLKDRGEWQTTRVLSVGGKSWVNNWKLNYDVSHSRATQNEKNSIDPMRFRSRYSGDGLLGVTVDYSDMEKPAYSVDFGDAALNDTSRYTVTAFDNTTREDALDEELALRFDASRVYGLAEGTFEVKFGAKVRQRDKSLDMTYDIFGGYDGDLTLTDVLGRQTYGLADMGPVVDLQKTRDFVRANFANFEREDYDSALTSIVEDYKASEDITAGYVQGRYDNGPLRVVGGVRIEKTELSLSGFVVNADGDDVAFDPIRIDRDYTDVLPSINVRYEASENIIVRGAAYASLVRPSFGKLAPRYVIEEDEASFGNPELDPYKATNVDLSVEYYFAPEAVISGGVFVKDIKDFIVDFSEEVDGEFNGIPYEEVEYAINGDTARVTGFEFSYAQAMTFLPAPWDGLLVNANYTYTDAEGDLLDRTIPLPAAAKHTANLVLGYEKGPLSLRLAGAYRSGYLDEVGGDPEEDRYVKDHFQVDLSAKYAINDHVRLFGEVVNANNATYTAYQKGPGGDRLLQYEEYSWTAKFGLKLNY